MQVTRGAAAKADAPTLSQSLQAAEVALQFAHDVAVPGAALQRAA